MKSKIKLTVIYIFCSIAAWAQTKPITASEIITLKSTPASADMVWKGGEHTTLIAFDKIQVVSNVSVPSISVFYPAPEKANGTALIIAPGGGFHFLSLENEGTKLAEWCVEQGITAFVLKYRLVPVADNPEKAFGEKMKKGQALMDSAMEPYIKLANDDGLAAITYVRENATKLKINPIKIGIIGFSAGGTVAANAGLNYTSETNRPDFFAPIYAALHVVNLTKLPAKPMPLFMTVASNDHFGFQPQSIELYKTWNAAKQSVELHIFEKGGHGFGMRKQGFPSDEWINTFGIWLSSHGWLKNK